MPELLDGKPLSADEILENARALAPWLRERADDIESARRLPPEVVARLREDGLFRMNMPRSWGGPEMTSMQQNEVIEELSRANASVGWCVMIGCDSGLFTAWLDDPVGREMFPRLDMVTAGWLYPVGQAHRVDGGYRVSGDWMFGSGCTHCDWLDAGCVVFEDGAPVLTDGAPEWRIMLAPPGEYELLDTWYTTGLCGSGSLDYRVRDLFVPEERTFSFTDPPKRDGTLYRSPEALLRKMSGVPLGIARDAIDTLRELSENRVDGTSQRSYRSLARVRSAVAEAEALYGSARAYLYEALETQWSRLDSGSALSPDERAHVWLSRTNAFQASRRVVQIVYDIVGGSAVYAQKSPLDRHLRDIQTICQHVVGQTKGWEAVGALLIDPDDMPRQPLL